MRDTRNGLNSYETRVRRRSSSSGRRRGERGTSGVDQRRRCRRRSRSGGERWGLSGPLRCGGRCRPERQRLTAGRRERGSRPVCPGRGCRATKRLHQFKRTRAESAKRFDAEGTEIVAVGEVCVLPSLRVSPPRKQRLAGWRPRSKDDLRRRCGRSSRPKPSDDPVRKPRR